MECPSCGAEVDKNAKYCSECGSSLESEELAKTASKEMQYDLKMLYYTWPFFLFQAIALPVLAQLSATSNYPFELGLVAVLPLGLAFNWIVYVKFLK